jgi:glycosyltransferase involved in cell wall biosynthesis
LSQPNANPLVTIGLPVYNEARFIDAALASLRCQDYPNLEIVISDNASTDRTVEICTRHAGEDPRIRIERAVVNRGAIANFQNTLDLAHGTYFMWAGGHDLWTPNLVSECVALMEANQGACLAFASSRWVGVDDEPLARVSGWSDTRGLDPVARLFTIFWGNMHPVMALVRTAQLRACMPLENLAGSDLVLLAELALRGDFLHAPDACWSRREMRLETHHDDKLRRYASTATGITRSRLGRMFPLLALPMALIRVVLRSRLPPVDKLAVLLALIASFPVRYLVGRRALPGR